MRRYSRLFLIIFSIILFIIALLCFYYLDIEGIKYNDLTKSTKISFALSGHTLFGGNSTIMKGEYIDGVLHMNTSLFIPTEFSFDYITFILFSCFTLSLIFMFIFSSKKILLFIFTLINTLVNISLLFQPLYFIAVNYSNKIIIENFFPVDGLNLIGIGSICFVVLMLLNDILYFYRIHTLYKKKPILIY